MVRRRTGSNRSARHRRLCEEIDRLRWAFRQTMLERIVEVARNYSDELARGDQAHRGRLARCERALVTTVEVCHKALNPGLVTAADLDNAKRSLARRRREAAAAKREAKAHPHPPPPPEPTAAGNVVLLPRRPK